MSDNKTYNGRAKLIAKLLRYLFLLNIGITVASLFLGDVFAQFLPSLYWPGVILDAGCTFGYAVFLLRLANVDKQYKTAGYCILIAVALRLLGANDSGNGSKLALFLSMAIYMVQFIGEYNEMTAHDTLLIETDFALSEKWTALRKWYMFMFLAYCMCLMIVMLIPTVGTVLTLAASIGMVVVSGFKVYFLYRSYQAFDAL